MQVHKAGGLDFECLQERHFELPKVVETYPYEGLSVSPCTVLSIRTMPLAVANVRHSIQ